MTEHKPDHQRWNYNIHYGDELLSQIPDTARTALDVGCGDGYVARQLVERGLTVTGIDADHDSIVRAEEQDTTSITYLEGDVMDADLPLGGFDVVTAIATLHHLDLVAGLDRLKELVAPGGQLLVVGLAKTEWPRDLPRDLGASFADKAQRLWRGYWDHGSPCVWPPPHTFSDVQRAAESALPGHEYSRKLLYRYTLTWTRPGGPAQVTEGEAELTEGEADLA